MNSPSVLDAGPLAMVTHPGGVPEIDACRRWLSGLLARGTRVMIPEIADYETRRELLRAGKTKSVARLDTLATAIEYIPLTTAAMRRAAVLWAEVRNQGRPTADAKALDADVILAAQALTLGESSVLHEPCIVLAAHHGPPPRPCVNCRPVAAFVGSLPPCRAPRLEPRCIVSSLPACSSSALALAD